MRTLVKERVVFILKYLVGLILLFWLLRKIDLGDLADTYVQIGMNVLIPLILLSGLILFVQFHRWRYLIESQSSQFAYSDLIPSFLAGFAFRLLIPGGHAEIAKVFLLPGKKSGKILAFALEKYFETYIKIILILIALPLVFPESGLWLWLLLPVAVILYFVFLRLFRTNLLRRYQEKDADYKKIFLRTAFYSLAIFAILIIQYDLLLNVGSQLSIYNTALASTFIWGAGLIPVTVSGLGIRENLAVFFLAKYGVPASAAVGASLLIFFLNAVLPALIGVIFIIKRRNQLRDVRPFVRKAGQEIWRGRHVKKELDTTSEVK